MSREDEVIVSFMQMNMNMIDTPLCPLKVVISLMEAVWDAGIMVNSLPSTKNS